MTEDTQTHSARNEGNGEAPDAWRMTDSLHAPHGKGDPFAAAIRATRMAMLITDPRQPDNPIVFANDAFLRLTGYKREEVVGNNCRFLQGPETNQADISRVRQAIAERRDINVDLLNYRKDGSTFWNALYISPVTTEEGELQFFFASQLDVTDRKTSERRVKAEKERFERAVKERTAELEIALEAQTALLHEVDHRVKNNLQMISSIIVMQSRTIPDPEIRASLRSMLERVEALSTVHRRLYQADDVTRFDLSDFIRDIVQDLLASSGHENVQADLDLDAIALPAEKAAPIALIVNELVTNTIKHAFAQRDGDARLGVSLKRRNGKIDVEIADNGNGMDDVDTSGSFGMKLIKALSRQLQAEVDWKGDGPGTRVLIQLPDFTRGKETQASNEPAL